MSDEPTPSAPFRHGLPHQVLHAPQLRGRGRAIGVPHLVHPDGRGARRTTPRWSPRPSSRGNRGTPPAWSTGRRTGSRPVARSFRSASNRSSGPIDEPSPKISSVTPWRRSPCERPSASSVLVGPAQHVDESRRHREPGGVHLDPSARCAEVTDGDNRIADDGHIGHARLAARPVVHGAVANHEVVGGSRTTAGEGDDGAEEGEQRWTHAETQGGVRPGGRVGRASRARKSSDPHGTWPAPAGWRRRVPGSSGRSSASFGASAVCCSRSTTASLRCTNGGRPASASKRTQPRE